LRELVTGILDGRVLERLWRMDIPLLGSGSLHSLRRFTASCCMGADAGRCCSALLAALLVPLLVIGASGCTLKGEPIRLAEGPAFAGDEFGEGLFGPRASDHIGRIFALFGPLLFEVLAFLAQEQRLDPHYGGVIVIGNHAG
jgi:hypothetical protein